MVAMGFPCGSDSKESTYNAGDPDSIPGSEISPGEGNGNPLQYSCLENSMARKAWRATVYGVTKSHTRLSNSHTHTHTHTMAMYVINSGADCVVPAQGFSDFAISIVAGESASMMIDSHGAGCLQGSSVPPCLGFSMVYLSEKVPNCPE